MPIISVNSLCSALHWLCLLLRIGKTNEFSSAALANAPSPSVHPGSLWPLHPQHGSRSHSWQAAGCRHGAAGLLQPRLVHLQRVVLAGSRLHHPGALRDGRSRRMFRWDTWQQPGIYEKFSDQGVFCVPPCGGVLCTYNWQYARGIKITCSVWFRNVSGCPREQLDVGSESSVRFPCRAGCSKRSKTGGLRGSPPVQIIHLLMNNLNSY